MKKIKFLVFLLVVNQFVFSQKKEIKLLFKNENTSAILLKKSDKTNFYIENKTQNKSDTILVKSFLNSDVKSKKINVPTDCKIVNFKAKEIELCLLTWTEVLNEKTIDLSSETLSLYAEIWNLKQKKRVFVNIQNIIKSKETVYLDKAKIASETKESIVRKGYEFVLNKDGGILLKSKSKQVKLVYSTEIEKYVNDVKNK